MLKLLGYQRGTGRNRHFRRKAELLQAPLLVKVVLNRAGDAIAGIDVVAALHTHRDNILWRIGGEIVPQIIVDHRMAGSVHIAG